MNQSDGYSIRILWIDGRGGEEAGNKFQPRNFLSQFYVLMEPEERRLDICLATPCIFSSQRAVYRPPKVQNFGRVSVNNIIS